jgi:hypothetical protein
VSEDESTTEPSRRPKRAPSVAVTFLPATYVTMTPEQEEKAVSALAGLLLEADERRAGRSRPAP